MVFQDIPVYFTQNNPPPQKKKPKTRKKTQNVAMIHVYGHNHNHWVIITSDVQCKNIDVQVYCI